MTRTAFDTGEAHPIISRIDRRIDARLARHQESMLPREYQHLAVPCTCADCTESGS